jgi:RLL motif-containing protein 1
MEALKTNNSGGIPLEEFPLGFSTGDHDVNQAAIVLKMLYLSDFREMQNDLNALIVLGQEYTANPRTNSSLGKVGR